MAKVIYHLTDDGPKKCTAGPGNCPIGGTHVEGQKEAWTAHEERMSSRTFSAFKRRSEGVPLPEFSLESHYGTLPPRAVQLEALNGVKEALAEEDQTQLVAACGTGKSYMGRQLMRHFMEQPDANGVAVVLTSSIKLAKDTAGDLRPDEDGDGYDRSIGEFGKDYVVIEVHSDVPQRTNELESVRDVKGTIRAERIKLQLEAALAAGKKVVIVSTYDSSDKVQEAQKLLGNPASGEADILMHDEAHNILGQQRPTTITTAENKAYVGFANEIPGSIQARKRLYATATPVVEESGDKESAGTIEDAIAAAERMKTDRRERVTFYSTDTAIVGKVGGSITQQQAIDSDCLAKPVYQLHNAEIKGDIRQFRNPRVDERGNLYEGSEKDEALSPQTYAAVNSTLNAMIADAEPNRNPSHNALAYAGSIDQANAFRNHFSSVALAQSGGMSAEDARNLMNSEDPELRRRARLRLLADNADVRSAHSSSPKAELEAAFSMFKGNDYKQEDAANGWSPNKKVLANVDIFSEGVNINEIDTVVVSDTSKTSERAMTQAIGRAIRKVRSNPYKSTGHVIVPQAITEDGIIANGGSVAAASYGATRVERSIALRKLSDQPIIPDTTTKFEVYEANGTRSGNRSARELGQGSLTEVRDVVAAATVNQAVEAMRSSTANWNELTDSEQTTLIVQKLHDNKNVRYAHRGVVAAQLEGKSHLEISTLRRSSKVLDSILSSGDMGALHPTVTASLVKHQVIQPAGETNHGPTLEEKRAVLKANAVLLAGGLAMPPAARDSRFGEIYSKIDAEYPSYDRSWTKLKDQRGQAGNLSEESQVFTKLLERDDKFADQLYEVMADSSARESFPRLRQDPRVSSFSEQLNSVEVTAQGRKNESASSGSSAFVANPGMLRKTGDLTAEATRRLASEL